MLSHALNVVLGLVPLSNSHRRSMLGDVGNVDLATDEQLTVFDSETLLLDEAGSVVGITAVIDGQELTLSGGNLPPGYSLLVASAETSRMEPKFEEDKASILAAAKCTSCLLIEEGELDGKMKRRYFGTPFFVTDHLLLTAGHNTVGVNSRVTRICITTPGLDRIQPWQMSLRKLSMI